MTKTVEIFVPSKSFVVQVPAQARIVAITTEPIDESDWSIASVLDNPIRFPPLREAVIVDDHIAIACSAAVDDLEELLAEVALYFLQAGIATDCLTIALAERCRFDRGLFLTKLQAAIGDRVDDDELALEQLIVVQGEFGEQDFAYLAADKKADPIYILRSLVEADFTLPIVPQDDSDDMGSAALGGMIPWFVDRKTRLRWNANRLGHLKDESTMEKSIAELRWLLGLQVALAVPRNWKAQHESMAVLACEKMDLNLRNRAVGSSSTNADEVNVTLGDEASIEPDLVLCCADRPGLVLDWESFAATVSNAAKWMPERRGRIAVCCDRLPAYSKDFAELSGLDDLATISNILKSSEDVNSFAIGLLATIMAHHSVFVYQRNPVNRRAGPWEEFDELLQLEALIAGAANPLVVQNVPTLERNLLT